MPHRTGAPDFVWGGRNQAASTIDDATIEEVVPRTSETKPKACDLTQEARLRIKSSFRLVGFGRVDPWQGRSHFSAN